MPFEQKEKYDAYAKVLSIDGGFIAVSFRIFGILLRKFAIFFYTKRRRK